MTPQEAILKLHDTAAFWAAGLGSAADVVRAACDALVAEVPGAELEVLASVPVSRADQDMPEILPAALREAGLSYNPRGSDEAKAAALKVMAARVLTGELEPNALTVWAHQTFGHDQLPLAETLADLDDEYDIAEYSQFTEVELDAKVQTEARRILDSPPEHAAYG